MCLEPLFKHREPRDAPESIVRLMDALQAGDMRLQSLVWNADFLTESAMTCFNSDVRSLETLMTNSLVDRQLDIAETLSHRSQRRR